MSIDLPSRTVAMHPIIVNPVMVNHSLGHMSCHSRLRPACRYALRMVATVALALFVLLPSTWLSSEAQAQAYGEDATKPKAAEDAEDSRAATFQAVRGKPTEQVSGGALLLSAYAVIWLLLLAYLFRMHLVSQQTQRRLEYVEAEIARRATEMQGS